MGVLWPLLLAVLHLAGWGGPWLDLAALSALSAGWGLGLDRAVALSWGLGFLMDAASLGPLGPQAMGWSAAAAALAVEQRSSHRAEVLTLMLAAGLVSLWLGLVAGRGAALSAPGELVLRAGVTALAAPLLLWPLSASWAERKAGA